MSNETGQHWFEQLSTQRPPVAQYEDYPTQSEMEIATARHADLSVLLLPEDQRPKKQQPECLQRTDGNFMFYRGKFNLIYGDPEGAKTFIAKLAITQTLAAGGTAAFIDLDHNGALEIGMDLVMMGSDPHVVADSSRFRVYEPEDGNQLHLAVADIVLWSCDNVVLDSLGELLPILGLKSNDNDEVTRALRTVLFPLTSSGASVLGIDHLPKGTPGMARNTEYSIGGIAKKRATNGLMVLVEKTQEFAPGQVGKSKLTITKDRIGSVRKYARGGKQAGVFVLDSSNEKEVRGYIEVPSEFTGSDGEKLPAGAMVRVSEWSGSRTNSKPFSKTTAEKEVEGRDRDIRTGIDFLVKYGYLTVDTTGAYEKFVHVKAFTWDEASKLSSHPLETPHWGLTE